MSQKQTRKKRPPQQQKKHTQPQNRRTEKIVKYKKPLNLNVGMVIFATIFVYLLVCIISYIKSEPIAGYEVTTGSLSISNVYDAIALREEQSISSNSSGYVNYFAKESSHVAAGDLVYTIDQSGTIASLMESGDESIMLSDSDLSQIRNEITDYAHTFSENEYSAVYDFWYSIQGTTLKLSNYNMLSNIDALSGANNVSFCYAPKSGTVVYNVDGYESLKPDKITQELFDNKASYEKQQKLNNTLIGDNDSVYKLITSNDWSIVFPISEERAIAMEEDKYVQVKFLKNQYTSWGAVTILRNASGVFAKLDFNNYMSTFASDRYLNVEILEDTEVGLKIPVSSIVNRNFYLIPKEYLAKGNNSSQAGFMLETFDEEGNITQQFTPVTIYSESDTDYYVDTSVLQIGDYICKQDSTDKYAISKTGSLVGVYNMNKGYADFTEITILSENAEYAIVKSNTQYGLSEYDHIVLDAQSVADDDFVR